LEVRRRSSQPKTLNENIRGRLMALAEGDVQNEFGVPFDCDDNF